jgi:hypothetical protein
MANLNPKTREEVESLKSHWKSDGCWDIETTEGFEDYHDELLAYRLEVERKHKENLQKKHNVLASKMCPMSIKWVNCGPDATGYTHQKCIVEGCAWWDGTQYSGACGAIWES